MTYKELYNAAFVENERNENDTKLEHLARVIYENNYDGITDPKEAVIRAMEIFSEMLGQDIDPTKIEFENAVYNVENPYRARVRRGLFKAMKNDNLCDYIMQNYMSFDKEDLARIIAEIDCAAYGTDLLSGKPDYHDIMNKTTKELRERWEC